MKRTRHCYDYCRPDYGRARAVVATGPIQCTTHRVTRVRGGWKMRQINDVCTRSRPFTRVHPCRSAVTAYTNLCVKRISRRGGGDKRERSSSRAHVCFQRLPSSSSLIFTPLANCILLLLYYHAVAELVDVADVRRLCTTSHHCALLRQNVFRRIYFKLQEKPSIYVGLKITFASFILFPSFSKDACLSGKFCQLYWEITSAQF